MAAPETAAQGQGPLSSPEVPMCQSREDADRLALPMARQADVISDSLGARGGPHRPALRPLPLSPVVCELRLA